MLELAIMRHRRPLTIVLGAALVWIVLGVARPTFDAGDGLVGEYFTNVAWTGSPAFSVVDTAPSASRMRQRWGGLPPEQFSVRWTGFLTVGQPDLYTFATTSDDGSQLVVDNRLVVDNGGMHSLARRSGRIQLDRGSHVIVLRYLQFGAASALDWSWSRDGGADEPVPAWALSQRPTRPATMVNARFVDGALRSLAIVVALTTLWYLRASVRGREQAVGRWLDARRRDAMTPYRNAASLVFSVSMLIVTLFLPWPEGGYQLSFRAVENTARHLSTSAMKALGSFETFQAAGPRPDLFLESQGPYSRASRPGDWRWPTPQLLSDVDRTIHHAGVRSWNDPGDVGRPAIVYRVLHAATPR